MLNSWKSKMCNLCMYLKIKHVWFSVMRLKTMAIAIYATGFNLIPINTY